MRRQLAQLEGTRAEFTGIFREYGQRRVGRGFAPTLLFTDVRQAQKQSCTEADPLADHVWINDADAFARLPLHPGTVVAFVGKVKRYSKGGVGATLRGEAQEQDFTIAQIERPRVVKRPRPDLDIYGGED